MKSSSPFWDRDEAARASLTGSRVLSRDEVDRRWTTSAPTTPKTTTPDPWWRDPDPVPAPGETTRHALEVYRTENAYLRLRLEDRALMDRRPWHEGRWIPHVTSDDELGADDVRISDAAEIVGVSRSWLAQVVTKGVIPSKQYLNGRRVRVDDVRAWKEAHEERRRKRDRDRTAKRRTLRAIASVLLVLSLATLAQAQPVVPDGQREGPPSTVVSATFATGSPRDPAALRLEWDPPAPGTSVAGWAVYLGPAPGQWTERIDVGYAGGCCGGTPWVNVPITSPGTWFASVVAHVERWQAVPPPTSLRAPSKPVIRRLP